MKTKLIGITIIIGLCFLCWTQFSAKRKFKLNYERASNNLVDAKFEIDTLTTEKGETFYKYSQMELKTKELEKFNSKIIEENKELGIKIKNLQSTTKIEYVYITNIDTIPTTRIDSNRFQASYKDEDINVNQIITLTGNNLENCIPVITDFQTKLDEELIISREFIYKRYWIFWKRVVDVKEYIKSDNKYFKLNRVESFSIIK